MILLLIVALFLLRGFYSNSILLLITLLILIIIIILFLPDNLTLPKFKKAISLFLPFTIWTALTSFWSFEPVYTLERSIYLALLLFSLSLIIWKTKNSNIKLLDIFYLTGLTIIVASFVSLLLTVPADSWSGGNAKGFMGFSNHQNTFASIFVFILPAFNYQLLSEYKSLKGKRTDLTSFLGILNKLTNLKIISLLILNLSGILLLIITFSRASFLSYLIFLSCVLMLIYSIRNYIIILGIMIIFLFVTAQFPIFDKFYHYMIYKGDDNIEATRMELLEASIKASKRGGIFGLGYGISDQNIILKNIGIYKVGMYVREKGNSTLALIEEVGIIGLILFYTPIILLLIRKITKYQNLYTSNKTSGDIYNLFIFSMLISLLIHAQFEAWFVGVGSLQLPLFFILFYENQ